MGPSSRIEPSRARVIVIFTNTGPSNSSTVSNNVSTQGALFSGANAPVCAPNTSAGAN